MERVRLHLEVLVLVQLLLGRQDLALRRLERRLGRHELVERRQGCRPERIVQRFRARRFSEVARLHRRRREPYIQ